MNQNRQRNRGLHQRTNIQNQVKKVRFDTSQQWRLSRRQIQANSPNRNIIQKNLSLIKSGSTPLKRAQAAYYGKKTNRSPLLATTSQQIAVKTEVDINEKLPVHARLGSRRALKTANQRNNIRTNSPIKQNNTVQELIAQKRALRLRTIQQTRKLRQLQALSKKTNIGGTLRSDQILHSQTKVNTRRMPRKNIRNRPRQMNGFASTAAADLSVSVANDLALKRQLLNGEIALNRSNRQRLNRQFLHSSEVDPQIQREISMIQERSRRMQMNTLGGVTDIQNLSPITTLHPAITPTTVNRADVIAPLSQLGGITSVVLENRPKISLHERFSRLYKKKGENNFFS